MTMANEWKIDFVSKELAHIDGEIHYANGATTVPAAGHVIRGNTSGAVGKILEVVGDVVMGKLILTGVTGKFVDNEALINLDQIPFDTVTNGGPQVGDAIYEPGGDNGIVRFIEYTGTSGFMYAEVTGASWTDTENITLDATSGTILAVTNGAAVDRSTTWTTVLTDGVLKAPSLSGIVNYDGGTVDIPRFAKVKDALNHVEGFVQDIYGITATGSMRLNDITYKLPYDTGGGTIGNVGDIIYNGTSFAIAEIISFDTSSTATSGTMSIRYLDENRFAENEVFTVQDEIEVDTFTLAGVQIGETVTEPGAGTMVVRAIKFTTAGEAFLYGETSAAPTNFAAAEVLQISAANVCTVKTTGVDGSGWTTATVNFGASNQQEWEDNNNINVMQQIDYDLVANGGFKIGDVVRGATGGATGKVIAVTATRLTFRDFSGTPFVEDEPLDVRLADNTLENRGQVNGITDNNTHAVTKGTPRYKQIAAQGGIYGEDLTTETESSINIIRDCNQLYSYTQDVLDELDAMDDQVIMTAQVKLQQYTFINSWVMPDLSARFLESGSLQDSNLDNIWTNPQSLGTVDNITDDVFAASTPQPEFYVEQDGRVLDKSWLEGHVDVLVKNKSNTDPRFDNTLGQLINGGEFSIFARNFGSTFDHFTTSQLAGVAAIPLATASDIDNPSGTHQMSWNTGSGATFAVGEEITTATSPGTQRGIVIAQTGDAGATGTLDYVLIGTQFSASDAIVGETSGKTAAVNGAVTKLVAGYSADITFSTVDFYLDHGGVSGLFQNGEQVSQTGTSATGIFMKDDTTLDRMWIGNEEGGPAWNGTGVVTGGLSTETMTPTTKTLATTLDYDIDDGNGAQSFNACLFLNKTAASARTLADSYEWQKYLCYDNVFRDTDLATAGGGFQDILGGAGESTAGVEGRIYLRQQASYPLVKASPIGTFAGGTSFLAQGIFILDMDNADIRNYKVIDTGGTLRTPPNLQALTVTGLVSGDRVTVFRRAGGVIDDNEYETEIDTGDHNGIGDSFLEIRTSGGTPPDFFAWQNDTPAAGVVRVLNATTGVYDSYAYTSQPTTVRLALSGTLTASYNNQLCYIPLIQETATSGTVTVNLKQFQVVNIRTRVRNSSNPGQKITPFEVDGTYGATGASVAAIRNLDTIVD